MTENEREDAAGGDPTSLKFVGEATAAVFDDADVDPADVRTKQVSHAQLLAAGVNPGVAAKIRRGHSLAWTFDGGEGLDQRAEQVRGLGDGERAWVSASVGDWEDGPQPTDQEAVATTDGSGSAVAAESAWQDRSEPTPVTDLDGIGDVRAETLATAGINSVRSLALADPDEVAESLDLAPARVVKWREQARQLL